MVDLLGGRSRDGRRPGGGRRLLRHERGRAQREGRPPARRGLELHRGQGASSAHPTLEGAAAITVIGGALPKLTERGLIAAEDYPLLRHLYEVIALEQPLDMPWDRFYTGDPAASTTG